LRERRAVRILIDLEPRNADEAHEKLLYLAALLGANAAPLTPAAVRRAIETLQPFKPRLGETMCRQEQAPLSTNPWENATAPGMQAPGYMD
jgi:hypothetical protein